jgi:ParB family transcriptional regulator, chromosome partitioning protein
MEIPIDSIIIKKRVRSDLGDLRSLMKSMRVYGLMHPIIVNSKNELIAGQRRLESAKQLGWIKIPAVIVDRENELEKLELEMEENLHRRNLSADELAEGYRRLDKLKNPGFFLRIWNAIRGFFKRLFGRKK